VLKHWITQHPIVAYLMLAFVVSWAIFLVPLLSKEGIGLVAFDAPPVELFILLVSMVGLAGSAFVVTAIVDGRPGVRALAGRYLRWRVGIRWYLVAFFGLLATALAGICVVYGTSPVVSLAHQAPLLIGYVLQVVLVAALVNLWEETGWTGFMFTRLQPRMGALKAALLVAPCFGAIHLPLLFITGGLTDGKFAPGQYPLVILELLILFSVPVRVIAAWLYNNAKGSLLLIGLFHGSLGATAGAVLLPYLVPRGANVLTDVYVSFAALALLIVVCTRGRLSYTPDAAAARPAAR
jgi:membrane protease YdiL (CAAX protease family)